MTADIAKTKAVKSGTSFILTDEAGDMPFDPRSPCGIYRNDMRLVRALTLAAKGLTASRDTVFYNGNLYQQWSLYAPQAVSPAVAVTFMPGCDDIFDVRNEEIRAMSHAGKPYRGDITRFKRDAWGLSVSTLGETTKTAYKTGFRSSAKGRWSGNDFKIPLRFSEGQTKTLYIVAGDENTRLKGALREQFEQAKRLSAAERETLRLLGPRIEAGDPLLNEALHRAQEDLSLLITGHETGPYPYAGLPWFSAPFGRDAAITAMLLIEHYPALAKGVLAFQAQHQAVETNPARQSEPGKIFHEMRFGEASAAGKNPFSRYYGGVDSTPLFVMLAGEYYRHAKDADFIRSIWPNITAALDWVSANMAENGGFVRYRYDKNGLTQQCWKDSADSVFLMDNHKKPAKDPVAVCEVQAYAYEAFKAGADFANLMGDENKAAGYARAADALFERFNAQFWMDDQNCYAMALDGENRQCAVISSNAGHCLLSDIVPKERTARLARRLMQDDIFSGYGIRTLARGPGYDPLSYHRGSVWPHDTAMVAMGMRKQGFGDFSNRLIDGLLGVYRQTGTIPELFAGDAPGESGNASPGPRRYPAACIMQAWAAAAMISLSLGRRDLVFRPPQNRLSDPAPLPYASSTGKTSRPRPECPQ